MNSRHAESVRVPLPAAGALQVYLSFRGEPADWAVVYVHGFGSTRQGEKSEALELSCARRGWTFASFDFRGHGQSTGTLLELCGSALLEDLDALWDYLVSRGVHRFCLVGSSMGGWAASWFSVRHPASVLRCALIAPAFDFLRNRWQELTEAEREAWKQTGRLRVRNQWIDREIGYGIVEEMDRFPLSRLAAEWAVPLLIFHGLQDDVVPYAQSLALMERATYPHIELRLYKNGDHRLRAFKDQIAEAACRFFAEAV